MEKPSKMLILTILTLIVTSIGVATPFLWKSSSKEISVKITQNAPLIEPAEYIKGLRITYEEMEVSALSRVYFEITNSGQSAIEFEDVVEPIEIALVGENRFVNRGEILSSIIVDTTPNNLNIELDASKSKIKLAFKLLNPGDKVVLSILVNVSKPRFSTSARISGVKEIQFGGDIDNSLFKEDIFFGTYIAILFSLLFYSLIFYFFIFLLPKKKRVMKRFEESKPIFSSGTTHKEIKVFINENLEFLGKKEKAKILKELYKLNDPLESGKTKELHGIMMENVMTSDSSGLLLNLLMLAGTTTFFSVNGLFL